MTMLFRRRMFVALLRLTLCLHWFPMAACLVCLMILFLWRWKTLILNTLIIQPLQWQTPCTVIRIINSIYLTTGMSQVCLLVKAGNLVRIFSPLCCMVVDCCSLLNVQYPTGVALRQWTKTMRIHNCVKLLLVIFTSTCEKLR